MPRCAAANDDLVSAVVYYGDRSTRRAAAQYVFPASTLAPAAAAAI